MNILQPTLVVLSLFIFFDKATAQQRIVSTLAGDGTPGFSDQQVNNPYGLVIGPDGGLYFCDLDNQRIRRLDLNTRKMTTIAGSGQRGYAGDGGPALPANLDVLTPVTLANFVLGPNAVLPTSR